MNVRPVELDDDLKPKATETVQCPNPDCDREREASPGVWICLDCGISFVIEGEAEVVDQ